MRIVRCNRVVKFCSQTAKSASDFASLVHNLMMDCATAIGRLHYMRGPGPNGGPSISLG